MIKDNLKRILESIEHAKIQYNRKDSIKLIAVSKYSNSECILEAFLCNQIAFGENKVQDLIKKKEELSQYNIEWHFIGTLQENKINALLKVKPTLIHSIHSVKLANALQDRLKRANICMDALLQINSSHEDSKSGFSIESAYDSYTEIMQRFPNIHLKGIMCMGANTDNMNIVKKGFIETKNVFDKLSAYGATILSMGMSSDYKIAIECGSNCLRIGSDIFKQH